MSPTTSRLSAARAAVRVARRDIWRNRGRSSLIALMVALPVLAVSTASVLYRSDQHDPQDVVQVALGDQSQARITYQNRMRIHQGPTGLSFSGTEDRSMPRLTAVQDVRALLETRISRRDRLLADVELHTRGAIRFNGQPLDLGLREIHYQAAGLGGLVEPLSGRAPAAPDEVVISRALLRQTDVRIGSELSLTPSPQSPPKRLRVVGVVGGENLVGQRSVIGRPGALIPAAAIGYDRADGGPQAQVSWQVLGPDPVTWNQVIALNQVGGAVTSRAVVLAPPDGDRISDLDDVPLGTTVVGITAVVIGLVLLQIALLAGPAIAVGARRNQRGLAIMASAGAERRHLRTVVLAGSGVIGLVAGLIAAALGAGLGAVIVAQLMRFDSEHLVRIDIHGWDLLALAAVGALTAVAAALIPAWQAARLDVLAVLTGRRRPLSSRVRIPLLGLIVTAAGAALAVRFSGQHQPVPAVAALALTEIGLILGTGAVVSLTARAADRLPFSPRFALRDAARQRTRTVPAVAAVLAAIAGASCALVYVASQAAHDENQYMPWSPLGTALLEFDPASPADPAEVEAVARRTLPVAALARYREVVSPGPGAGTDLDLARPPQNDCPPDQDWHRLQTDPRCRIDDERQFSGVSQVFDDGSAYPLLAGVDDTVAVNALRAGRVLVGDPLQLWPDGSVHVRVIGYDHNGDEEVVERTVVLPATLVSVPTQLMLPVFPLTAAKPLGVTTEVRGLVVETSRMPTAAEEEQASDAVTAAGAMNVMLERGYQGNLGLSLLALVIAAAVVGLGGTFTAVGLAAAESRTDVATLAAVGASPGVRRRLAASQAAVIAGLGSVLGVLSGLAAGWVLVRMHQPLGGEMTSGVQGWSVEGWSGNWELVLPWAHLFAIGAGIPLLAVVIGYLITRSRLPLVRRFGQ